MKDLVLITPPFTQLNTAYPATAYLKGFLNTKGIGSYQMDLGLEVTLALFSKRRLTDVFEIGASQISTENAQRIYALKSHYISLIDEVILFLQGGNPTFARQICSEGFLPMASRFDQLDELEWAFGHMGQQDKAKHLATLFLEDLSDFIVECIDEHFGFSRYAEKLGMSANSFDDLYEALKEPPTFIDEITFEVLQDRLQDLDLALACFSVPFPGNLYSAFRCASWLKQNFPQLRIAMGGGFPNTELRSISDPRVFDFFDYITLDDGELPIELLVKAALGDSGEVNHAGFKRTFLRVAGEVIYDNSYPGRDYRQAEIGTPDYSDLLLDKYVSVIEIANPMHSLWSDGRWNKLTMAHGCYWGKCTFCDISLDYIKLYEPLSAKLLVDRMEELIAQTGETGFHFVDEAAPPALMKNVAIEILKRELTVTWWTNIRFEKSFTADLCILLKAAGCIAVSGGLEVASDRLLALIDKGVTVQQVAQVVRNFTDAGILVHAYLMYGYPTQTIQETVDSLEMVRQLFGVGILQSGFWHQFALTAHSPVGLAPADYGIVPEYEKITFAKNDIQFEDQTGIDHSLFSHGLRKSLFNYMHGLGFDMSLQEWFDFEIPETTIAEDYIASCLDDPHEWAWRPNARLVWLGNFPEIEAVEIRKKKKVQSGVQLTFHEKTKSFDITLEQEKGKWLVNQLEALTLSGQPVTLSVLKGDFEKYFGDFEPFWYSKPINLLRENGLLIL